MIEQVIRFKTSDGQEFEALGEAQMHERNEELKAVVYQHIDANFDPDYGDSDELKHITKNDLAELITGALSRLHEAGLIKFTRDEENANE